MWAAEGEDFGCGIGEGTAEGLSVKLQVSLVTNTLKGNARYQIEQFEAFGGISKINDGVIGEIGAVS